MVFVWIMACANATVDMMALTATFQVFLLFIIFILLKFSLTLLISQC